MDDCETWVYEYLRYMGVPADEIIFEPNGKSTFPDFQVKGRIGVEVRRLNQHKKNEQGRWEPLEELARPLHDRLLSLLDEFGPPAYGASWHVLYRFQRPQKTKKWEPVLRHKLKDFLGLQLPDHETTIFIDEHFELRLLRRAEPSDKTFILIDIDDFDSGGWVDAELQANIPISIDEKTNKRAAYRGHYDQWWLVLVDHIVAGERGDVELEHDWDKIIVIFPKAYERAYEIPSTRRA